MILGLFNRVIGWLENCLQCPITSSFMVEWTFISRLADSRASSRVTVMDAPRNPAGWFEIYVQDMDRAKEFYQNTFGTVLEKLDSPDFEMWAFPGDPHRPGCAGALAKMDGKDSGAGGIIIYFSCKDCAVEAARAAAHGGRIAREKFSIGPYGFISLVLDTEGNRIGLHSMR